MESDDDMGESAGADTDPEQGDQTMHDVGEVIPRERPRTRNGSGRSKRALSPSGMHMDKDLEVSYKLC
jgi:hypothetical protein